MKTHSAYECEICHTRYDDAGEAEACEVRHREYEASVPDVHVGDVVNVKENMGEFHTRVLTGVVVGTTGVKGRAGAWHVLVEFPNGVRVWARYDEAPSAWSDEEIAERWEFWVVDSLTINCAVLEES